MRFGSLITLALDGIVSHSIAPLRLASFVGFSLSIAAVLAIGVYLVRYQTNWPAGFATLAILMLISLAMNALFLGIIGEYIGRMYRQVKAGPLTIVDRLIGWSRTMRLTSRKPIATGFPTPTWRCSSKSLAWSISSSTPASLIDVGCGNGALLHYLSGRSAAKPVALTGVDLAANRPQAGIEFIQGDIFLLDIARQFSIVVSLMTIEHIADIRGFVRRLRALAKPGGLVVINTINDDSTLYMAARMLRRFGVALPFERIYSRHHLHHFGRASLSNLLRTEGLRPTGVILGNAPLASLDIPVSSRAASLILRGAVSSLFALGSLSSRTYAQTVICRREADERPTALRTDP